MGVVSTPAAPLRTLRVAAAYLVRGVARGGCERVEERGVRVRARGKSVYISSLVQKRPKTARAPRARALASPQHSHSKSKDAASRAASGFFDQKRDVSESVHGSSTANLAISCFIFVFMANHKSYLPLRHKRNRAAKRYQPSSLPLPRQRTAPHAAAAAVC